MKFEKKDIVKFIDEAKVCPDYLLNVENIYQVISVDGDIVKLTRNCAPVIETQISELTGVCINGIEDRFIYYDPVIMASIVMPGDPVPVHRRDYTYYLDANATFPHNKTMQDFVDENGFKYVHELQHYLRRHFQTDDLKIKL